jgi:hypothetical protein
MEWGYNVLGRLIVLSAAAANRYRLPREHNLEPAPLLPLPPLVPGQIFGGIGTLPPPWRRSPASPALDEATAVKDRRCMIDITSQKHVALCPNCAAPHAYTQVRFRGGLNDDGCWSATCAKCGQAFHIRVVNPTESHAEFKVEDRFDSECENPELPFATDSIVHDVPESDFAPAFDYGGAALYRCPKTGTSLEHAALQALQTNFERVSAAYHAAENYLCSKGAFRGENAVVHVKVSCSCELPHVATFYTAFPIDFAERPIGKYHLADISGIDIADRLEGLFSKSDIMSFLSKLLIRWHLTCDRIIVASPFVGHQFDKLEEKYDRWSWLLSQLAPERATLITRPATFNAFRSLSAGDVTYDLLKRYGLENKIIAANAKKQDFHAKFFIGLAKEGCEVLSGSANLVHGPSIENITFRSMSLDRCKERYLDVINVTLPAHRIRNPQYVRISQSTDGSWSSIDATGSPLAASDQCAAADPA